jgi:serine/threonine-protein kinase RsbW
MPLDGRACCDTRAVIPATFDAIEQLFAEFRATCQCVQRQRNRFAAELVLREALTNALVHGNRRDPAKLIRCALRMKRGRLIIAVEDMGEGFDWRIIRDREADPAASCGRGMGIFRRYATRVRFNEKGNGVAIVMNFDEGV